MNRKPLSPAMQHVLDRMTEGWALGRSSTVLDGGLCWLQKNGVGQGGPCEDVKRATVDALHDRGLILYHYAFPSATYTLTQKTR